jgi:hypothetical protein
MWNGPGHDLVLSHVVGAVFPIGAADQVEATGSFRPEGIEELVATAARDLMDTDRHEPIGGSPLLVARPLVQFGVADVVEPACLEGIECLVELFDRCRHDPMIQNNSATCNMRSERARLLTSCDMRPLEGSAGTPNAGPVQTVVVAGDSGQLGGLAGGEVLGVFHNA